MNPLDAWIDDVSRCLAENMRGFEARLGYPPGENVLRRATPEQAEVAARLLSSVGGPRDLLDFYARVDSISMPDVGNGIFVSPAREVADGEARGWPTKLSGAVEDEIMVFASDGGGAMFALSRAGDRAYRLSWGSLIGSTYDVPEDGLHVLPNGFRGFLEYVQAELSKARR